jgi:hypothetical protein
MAKWLVLSVLRSDNVKQDNGTCIRALMRIIVATNGNQPGLSIVCDTPANALQRFVSAGIQGGITGNDTTNTTGSTGKNDPNDDGECDDNTGTGVSDGGADDSGYDRDEEGDSTSSTIATPTNSTGVSTANSQASNSPVATVTVTASPNHPRPQHLGLSSVVSF